MTHGLETGTHPYDYYYRPGLPLRPPPPRAVPSDLWFAPRKAMLGPWIDVRREPVDTPRTRLMADHLWQGDEPMDALVAAFGRLGSAGGRRMLNQALAHGIDSLDDPLPELVDLFARLDNPPDWYDPDLWEYGRQRWINVSLAGKMAMGVQDFMGTFVGAEVASAVGQTGRFVKDPYRRGLESSVWFRSVTAPRALERSNPIFHDTIRVRFMHAQVRAMLRRTWGDEHFAQHGNPISNATTMGAAVTFGISPICFDHVHGRRCTTRQLDAVMHYWSYIAYVFGVAEELIPRSAAEGMEQADYMVATAGVAPRWTANMAGAATRRFTDSTLTGRLQIAATAPLLGALAYYSSEPLVRTLTADTPLHSVPLRPFTRLVGMAANTEVRVRALDDRLPGARSRMTRRARHIDPMWDRNTRLARYLAARVGIRGTPFDHHDSSACPV
ncbi:oxygenase MpaB family protein [Nocardia sp. CDC153]|uniref:oxygenase MpaB family protein n=1 Tax=Nocardia sp. CDC153 TaxID=3112167 RepID=UPI002DB744B6|nr:oxygenase MpaB family protein [Nocardia sp. CDC153]MEC3957803.1 oxygenase MpaB family protein [Nocardia sp. CDC153]